MSNRPTVFHTNKRQASPIHFTHEELARPDAWAAPHGLNRSPAVRHLLEIGEAFETEEQRVYAAEKAKAG